MTKMKFGSLAVFLLFFGVALVGAIRSHNWVEAIVFAALGILSLWADLRNR